MIMIKQEDVLKLIKFEFRFFANNQIFVFNITLIWFVYS